MNDVVPQYPWDEGDHLFASALNAAIANGPYMPSGGAFSLIYFGGKSDGTTDDAEALNEAIATVLALSHGGKIILPAGRTVIGSAIIANIPAGKTLTIEGMGPQASELYFSNATDGLNFTLRSSSPNVWGAVNLHSFSMVRGPTSPAIANTGVRITGDPAVAAQCSPMMSFRDLFIGGSIRNTNQWQNGLILDGISGYVCDNVTVLGNNATGVDQGDVGLTINGPGNPHFAANVNISNSTFQGASCGIGITGYVQGVLIVNCNIIGNYDSVRWLAPAANIAEELAVSNCSMAGSFRCLYTTLVNQMSVTGGTLLRFPGASSWAGIEINQGAYCSIVGNNFVGNNTGSETGLLLSNCGAASNNTVIGNVSTNITGAGIWLQGTTTGVTVVGNNIAGGTGFIQDSYPNTVFSNSRNGAEMVFAFFEPIVFRKAGTARWFVGNDGTAEGGGDTGNNFEIVSARDDGSLITAALSINRANSHVTLAYPPIITNLPLSYANDAAAATGGVSVGGIYRNGSVLQVRVT